MNHLTQSLDDNSALGDGQYVSARLSYRLGNVHIHFVVQGRHRRVIVRACRGIGQRPHDVSRQAVNLHREGYGEVLQALYPALGRINRNLIIERGPGIGNRVIEVELMYLLAQRGDDNRPGGNRQGIVTSLGDFLGSIYQQIEAHLGHLGVIGVACRGVGKRSPAAKGYLGHILRERDGEILQTLHLALSRGDGDLVIKRFNTSANRESQRQREQLLAIHREGSLGQVQVILS